MNLAGKTCIRKAVWLLKALLGVALSVFVLVSAGCSKKTGYAETSADVADSFPLEAEVTEANPQIAKSSGPYAILHTTAGDITILLYPEHAPKAVENFLGLAKEGYYDGTRFHYVRNGELAQAGRPVNQEPSGMEIPEGETSEAELSAQVPEERSLWGAPFEDEFHDELHNYPGAVGMAGDGEDNNLSQFYLILKNDKADDERIIPANLYMNELIQMRMAELKEWDLEDSLNEEKVKEFEAELNQEIQAIGTDGVPEAYAKKYEEIVQRYDIYGGAWNLDYKYTVFGQIVEGLNIAEAITQVKVEAATRSPKKDVVIDSIEIRE